MAPNSQPVVTETNGTYQQRKVTLKVTVDDGGGGADKACPVPLDDTNPPVLLGRIPSLIVSGVVLSIYAYAAYYLYLEYSNHYFRKDVAVRDVPNFLIKWSPLYIVGIIMEGIYAALKGQPVYETGDTLCSLSVMFLRIAMTNAFQMTVLCYSLYGMVWNYFGRHIHEAILPNFFQESALLQLLGVVVFDEFAYYWVHRFGHTFNFFWAVHQMHHNGEVFNVATGIRNSIIVRFSFIIFYLPLALVFDPPIFIMFRQFNLVYQVWIHTVVIGKLGWLEYIFNTPSQHRVHHGRNQYCIDRNFGGITCVFDRLFGTFQEEIEEVPVVYGLTNPINSHDPWKLNWLPFYNMFKTMQSMPNWKEKFLIVWNGPGRIPMSNPPQEYPIPPITNNTFQHRQPKFSTPLKILLVFEISLAMIVINIVNSKMVNDPQYYWYYCAILLYCAFSFYGISTSNDHLSNSGSVQLVTVLIGFCLFSFGSVIRYQPEFWITTVSEIVIYVIISILFASAILAFKQEMETPLPEECIAKDLPYAKEACEAQWKFYEESKKQKLKCQ